MDMYTDSDLALKLKKWSLEKMNYFSSNLENSDTEFHAPSDSDFNRYIIKFKVILYKYYLYCIPILKRVKH